MELVPGHHFVRTGQEMRPEANEKEPFLSWDGHTTPLSYCFAYLISQRGLRSEDRGRKVKKGEGLASKLRGRDKVPICAKRTCKGNALEK